MKFDLFSHSIPCLPNHFLNKNLQRSLESSNASTAGIVPFFNRTDQQLERDTHTLVGKNHIQYWSIIFTSKSVKLT